MNKAIKEGTRVYCSNSNLSWCLLPRIYLMPVLSGHLCVAQSDEDAYLRGDSYNVMLWHRVTPVIEEETATEAPEAPSDDYDGYEKLADIFVEALDQAAVGKGKERHATDGEPFEDQQICEITRRVGLGFPLGQAVKKIYESSVLDTDAGIRELLGALNYIAGAIIVKREGLNGQAQKS